MGKPIEFALNGSRRTSPTHGKPIEFALKRERKKFAERISSRSPRSLRDRGDPFPGQGSNLRHPAPKAGVLPVELPGRRARSVVGVPQDPVPPLDWNALWVLSSRSAGSACARRSTARCSSAPASSAAPPASKPPHPDRDPRRIASTTAASTAPGGRFGPAGAGRRTQPSAGTVRVTTARCPGGRRATNQVDPLPASTGVLTGVVAEAVTERGPGGAPARRAAGSRSFGPSAVRAAEVVPRPVDRGRVAAEGRHGEGDGPGLEGQRLEDVADAGDPGPAAARGRTARRRRAGPPSPGRRRRPSATRRRRRPIRRPARRRPGCACRRAPPAGPADQGERPGHQVVRPGRTALRRSGPLMVSPSPSAKVSSSARSRLTISASMRW